MNFDVFSLLNYGILIFILLETSCSLYKKDSKHSLKATVNNFLNGVFLFSLSKRIALFYFLFIFNLIPNLNTTQHFEWKSFIACLLIMDFLLYILHRTKHFFPILWGFHLYHHSDKQINSTTTLRVSFVEQLYVYLFLAPLLIIGFSSGIVLLSFMVLSAYQVYVHNCYIKLPSFLETFLVSPRIHKIHHSADENLHRKNYGAMFTFWDKLFDTYSENETNLSVGIPGETEDNFVKNQLSPLKKLYKKYA